MASKAIYSVVAVIGIVAASGAAWWYMGKPLLPKEIGSAAGASAAASAAAPASAARAAGVEVARAERATLQDDAQSVGSLRSLQSVMLRPEVPGRVLALGFADGAMVRKGQVLVQLDDTLQRAEIRQAQAQVSIALSNYKRNQELVAQNFVAQRVLEESSASLQVAEAQLALSCARWSRMAIVAPFDGTVGIRNINPGDFVKDGADLINLEDIGSMYVDFRLPERYQSKLQLGQKVELQLDAFPGRIFKASVQALDPLLDVNGRSVGVRAVLPNTMGEVMAQAGRASQAGGAASSARAGARPVA
ncbi:MAG: efflux RND transporter periplasmic adaptor subunit, partial [Betaproteobacteria bacterium]|nr:efflux RND transporter periplasmic adaptor subunit [Betaproteobacteria bacterium]